MKFNIKNSNFKEFLKLVIMEGKNTEGKAYCLVDNCLLTIKNGKIYTNVMARAGIAIGMIKYKEVDIITPGEFAIANITLFLEYLNRFENDDELTIELKDEDNKVKIQRKSPRKTASIPIMAKENADDSLRASEGTKKIKEENGDFFFGGTKLDIKLVVDCYHIKQVIGDGDIGTLRRKYLIIVTNENGIMRVGDKIMGIIESELPVTSKVGEGTAIYADGIDNVFKELKGDVEIFFANGAPMIVKKYSDRYDVRYVLAPIVDDE